MKARLRAIEHLTGCVDVSEGRLRHDPRGQVDRVPHERVRAPIGWPDLAGEHVTAVDPDADRQPWRGLHHLAQREQHAFLVVPDRPRRAGAHAQLPPIGGDIGVEEADLVAVGRVLDEAHDLVEALGGGARTVLVDEVVESAELEEGDRRASMLGDSGRGQQVRTQSGGKTRGQCFIRWPRRRLPRRPWGRRRRPGEEHAGAPGRPPAAAGEKLGGLLAEEDLPRRRAGLHRHYRARGGPGDQILTMRSAHQERLIGAGMDADGHPQHHVARPGLDAADAA
jgi:hypothetical protein